MLVGSEEVEMGELSPTTGMWVMSLILAVEAIVIVVLVIKVIELWREVMV